MICWATLWNINGNTLCIPMSRPSHLDIILLWWSMTISAGHYFVLPPAFPHIEESCAIHERPQDSWDWIMQESWHEVLKCWPECRRERTATTLETLVLRGSQNWSTGLLCWATVISLYYPGMFTNKTCWHVAHRTYSMTQTSLTCTVHPESTM